MKLSVPSSFLLYFKFKHTLYLRETSPEIALSLFFLFPGGGPTDSAEVKSHPFFSSICWDDLLRKNIPAPFIPQIGSATDVSNFSEEFTTMEAVDSPGVVPPNVEKVFRGYSYVAPSILFTENNSSVLTEDMFRPSPDKKPSTSNLVGCFIKVRRENIPVSTYKGDLKQRREKGNLSLFQHLKPLL